MLHTLCCLHQYTHKLPMKCKQQNIFCMCILHIPPPYILQIKHKRINTFNSMFTVLSEIAFSNKVYPWLPPHNEVIVREVNWPTMHPPPPPPVLSQTSLTLFLRVYQIHYKLFPRKLLGCTRVTALDVRVPSFTLTEDAKARWKTTWIKSLRN